MPTIFSQVVDEEHGFSEGSYQDCNNAVKKATKVHRVLEPIVNDANKGWSIVPCR